MDLTANWEYITLAAQERLRNNRGNAHHVSRYGEEIELIGAAGEIAAHRFFGMAETLHTHTDGGIDLVYNGQTIDVKATRFTPYISHRYLQWPEGKPVKSEIILLTGVDIQHKQAAVLGYARREEILKASINRSRMYPCHEIPVNDLHPAWELMIPQAVVPRAGYQAGASVWH